MTRDVADDHQPPPILHEFLDQLAGDARLQPEEFVVEAFNRNHDQRGAILKCLADEIDGVVDRFAVWSRPATHSRMRTPCSS